jgi:DNA polymerase III alpha subunit (gram-positive type)
VRIGNKKIQFKIIKSLNIQLPNTKSKNRKFSVPVFATYNCHTQYSLLDGAAQTSTTLIGKAVKEEMKAIAITDHGNMFGVLNL